MLMFSLVGVVCFNPVWSDLMVHLVTFSCGYPTGSFRFPRNTYRPCYRRTSDYGKRDTHPQIAYIYGDGIEDGFALSRNPIQHVDCVFVVETCESANFWKFDIQSLWRDEPRVILWGYRVFDPADEIIFV
jgi:hypothetical protein